MAGNGYFADGVYQALSTETWADLTNGWDTYNDTWTLTPDLPLEFTTQIFDFGRVDYVSYLLSWQGIGASTTTVYYGDTVDSTGGDIDSPTTITATPGDTLSPVKARYFQFKISIDYFDSAGAEEAPTITNIRPQLTSQKVNITKADLNSSTLGGSIGERQLTIEENIQTVTSIITQPHFSSSLYVADDYVASDYVEAGNIPMPKILVDKTTSPITLNIFELDTFGKTKRIDCVFDAMISGIAPLTVTPNGSITQG